MSYKPKIPVGLVKSTKTPLELIRGIYKNMYSNRLMAYSKNIIFESCRNEYEKIIHPDLYKIIGEYDFEPKQSVLKTYVVKEVMNVISYVYYDMSYKSEVKRKEGVTHNQLYSISSIIENNIDDTGCYVKYEGRDEKLLRFLKKQLQKISDITDEQFERLQFVSNYNSIKQNKGKLTLVITNSLISTVGMSSYPHTDKNGYPMWKSCQKLDRERYSKSVWCNVTDPNSLIAYVTNKMPVKLQTECTTKARDFFNENEEDYKHYCMEQRTMLRYLVDDDNNKYIVMDRHYPNNKYLQEMCGIIEDLCDKNNIRLGIFSYYNQSQGSMPESIYNIYQDKYIQVPINARCVLPIPVLVDKAKNTLRPYYDNRPCNYNSMNAHDLVEFNIYTLKKYLDNEVNNNEQRIV